MTPPEVAVAGHFGEFLQGRLGRDGPIALVTVPCPQLRVAAWFRPGPGLSIHGSGQRLLTPLRARRFLATLDRPLAGSLRLRAAMPAGGGAGASTATLVALARLADPGLSPERIARACLTAEGASDPLMYPAPERLLWASREGRIIARLPGLPRLAVMGGFLGPVRPTDPADNRFPDIADLIDPWIRAAASGRHQAVAELATVSARRTMMLRGGDETTFATLMAELSALGVVIGHTGSLCGFLFVPGRIPANARALLREAGFRGVVGFLTGGGPCRTRSSS